MLGHRLRGAGAPGAGPVHDLVEAGNDFEHAEQRAALHGEHYRGVRAHRHPGDADADFRLLQGQGVRHPVGTVHGVAAVWLAQRRAGHIFAV